VYAYRRLSGESNSNGNAKGNLPLPPGPKQDPIIGSLRSFPQERWMETFSAWQKTYGDIIYLNVLGTSMLVINSLEIAKDLTEKKGHIYSGRPQNIMNNEV
jgi:hypothetical protein